MDSIRIKLTRKEWVGLSSLVLAESSKLKAIEDRYYRALLETLLRQVYHRLHIKLDSLKEAKNALNLSFSEAAAFNMVFADEEYEAPNSYANAILTSIISQIDQKIA